MRRVLGFCVLACGLAGAAGAQTFPLTVSMTGTDFGRVAIRSSDGLSFSCFHSAGSAAICSPGTTASIANGSVVTVSAGASSSGVVPGLLSGGGAAAACAASVCRFTMASAASINVEFSAGNGPAATLTISLTGAGTGSVAIDGGACTCVNGASPCGIGYLQGTTAHLSATPGVATRFGGYSNAASCGTAAACDVTLAASTTVVGSFPALVSLAVSPTSASATAGGPAQTLTAIGSFADGVTETVVSGTGSWLAAPPLPTAHGSLAAATLDGKIYAVGGFGETFGPEASVAVYDPAARTWTARAPMPTPRQHLAAAISGEYVYAIGGEVQGTTVERYDPLANTWTTVAPLSVPRYALAAATVNGIIYAAGGTYGGASLSVLEAYDPAVDAWTTRAPMPIAGARAAGVINGILYAVGGSSGSGVALQAYDPASNSWTAKAALPEPLGGLAAAVADGILYVVGNQDMFSAARTYVYDPVLDAWSLRSDRPGLPFDMAMASLGGRIYAVGGLFASRGATLLVSAIDWVDVFEDSLRWSSSAPAVVSITQHGVAMPLHPGMAIVRATAGTVTCAAGCATFTVTAPPADMALDSPVNNSSVSAGTTLFISGWALNKAASSGTGVDAVHVYAVPDGGAAIFLGVATDGIARSDVGAVYGAQFTNSGFTLSAGATLAPGSYTVTAYAHNAITGVFDATRSASITIAAPVSNGFLFIDTPAPSSTLTSAFEVGGWAVDSSAASGTGVDQIHMYIFPNDGAAPPVYIGMASVGWARPDVGAILGSQFTNSGFHFTVTGAMPGNYVLGVYAHSSVTNTFSIVKTLHFTVNANSLMSIDVPSAEATITAAGFGVSGWALDRAAASGTGVDALHVYAYRNPQSGSEPAIFLGVASLGLSRPDVASLFGSRYNDSGYVLNVDRAAAGLTPGVYDIVVWSHSTATNSFNNVALVRVRIQ
jgi:hypothetical protein